MYSCVEASDGARWPFFLCLMSLQKRLEATARAPVAPAGSFDNSSCFDFIFFPLLFGTARWGLGDGRQGHRALAVVVHDVVHVFVFQVHWGRNIEKVNKCGTKQFIHRITRCSCGKQARQDKFSLRLSNPSSEPEVNTVFCRVLTHFWLVCESVVLESLWAHIKDYWPKLQKAGY